MTDGIKAVDALRIPSDPDEAERYAHEQIEILRQEFQMKAQPFVALLFHITAAKPLTYDLAAVASQTPKADYVIWSNEHRGWWAPAERGYVKSLAEAGRYSQARAMQIAGSQWAMPFEGIPNEIAMRLDDALEQVHGPNA